MKVAKAEYQIPANDPIFTHKVEQRKLFIGEKMNSDGELETIPLEEYMKISPEVVNRRTWQQLAHNQWHSQMAGMFWLDAINSGIEQGFLSQGELDDEMCQTLSDSWGAQNENYWDRNKVDINSYEEYLAKVKAHAEMLGAKLYLNPVVGRGNIAYYFNANKFADEQSDASSSANNQEKKAKSRLTKQEKIDKYFLETGLGYSGWIKTHGKYKTEAVEPEGFRVLFDVSKDGFINFYSRPNLQKPPEYLYDDYTHEPHFIKSKPIAYFGTTFAIKLPKEIYPKHTYWLVTYGGEFENMGDGKIEIGKQKISVGCKLVGYELYGVGESEMKPPFFDLYSLEERKACKPYNQWYQCYIRNKRHPIYRCDEISREEPEFCE